MQKYQSVEHLVHYAMYKSKVLTNQLPLFLEQGLKAFAGHILYQNMEFIVFIALLVPVGTDAHEV